jgi:hypothetical protein
MMATIKIVLFAILVHLDVQNVHLAQFVLNVHQDIPQRTMVVLNVIQLVTVNAFSQIKLAPLVKPFILGLLVL